MLLLNKAKPPSFLTVLNTKKKEHSAHPTHSSHNKFIKDDSSFATYETVYKLFLLAGFVKCKMTSGPSPGNPQLFSIHQKY